MQMKMQMKGIQFLLYLILLHTVVGKFIESSSWMTCKTNLPLRSSSLDAKDREETKLDALLTF